MHRKNQILLDFFKKINSCDFLFLENFTTYSSYKCNAITVGCGTKEREYFPVTFLYFLVALAAALVTLPDLSTFSTDLITPTATV